MELETYKIYTLGCKVNQYDSGRLEADLKSAGFSRVKSRADFAIINTCCVTKTAVHKCIRTVNKAKAENPGAKIILMGCWPKAYKKEIQEISVDAVIGGVNNKKVIRELEKLGKKKHQNCKEEKFLHQLDRSRYFLKIQDGCEQYCTYCIIPYTRGKIKSRGEKSIIDEFKAATSAGYSEIVLTGIHLGLYGKEKNGNTNLFNLLKKLITIEGNFRIRLSSIEINEVEDDLIKLIENSQGKICKHLHIPLQSGSDKILRAMNRFYNTKYFFNKIKKIRRAMPDIAISTDIIVGFPGETENDFNRIFQFTKKLQFSRLHVFPFSPHEKTPAFKMANQIDKQIALKRAKKLRKLGNELALKYKKCFRGKHLKVVVENKKGGKYSGKTEYYFDIEFAKSQIYDIKKYLKILPKRIVEIIY